MQERLIKAYSPWLSREMETLVFGHAGYPVVLFPTSMGRYFETKDFKLIESVAGFLEDGKIVVYCPDGVDRQSWYNYGIHPADRVKTHLAYENFIVKDIFDLARRETGSVHVATAGCSFGGYHAANVAFRHPDQVGFLISMGGSFDIRQFIHGYYDDNCYFNNPSDYLPNMKEGPQLATIRHMGIVLGTGEYDMCLNENLRLSGILHEKGIDHWLDIRKGVAHDWPWWREMFPTYVAQIYQAKD